MSDTQTPKPAKKQDVTDHMKNGKTLNFEDHLEDMPTGESEAEKDWKGKLSKTEKGTVKGTFANVCTILQYHPQWKKTFAINPFNQKMYWRKEAPESFPGRPKLGTPYEEQDTGFLALWLADSFGIDVPLYHVAEAVMTIGYQQQFHPIKEYLQSLQWDKTPRLDTWTIRLLGVKDNIYTRAVSAKWMISAIARIEQPGAKADCMLILEGEQGLLKSTTFKALCKDERWFTDHLGELGHKDTAQQLQGRWIIEFAELDHFDRTEVNRMKSFLSQNDDSFRPPYGRQNKTFPRQFIFGGSCNGNEYLRDETGGRRFWPLACTNINIQALKEERDQLWAEARARYLANEHWWLEDPEVLKLAKEEQSARYQTDAWEDLVAEDVSHRESVTVGEILDVVMKREKGAWSQSDQNRIARILKKLGWKRSQLRVSGRRIWRYFPPASEPVPNL